MSLILICVFTLEFCALQDREKKPTDDEVTEGEVLHNNVLTLKGLVLCLYRTEAKAGASGICLAVLITA